MKIHIAYQIKNSAWGGGNQFLRNLMGYFRRTGTYADNISDADAVLFNSHHSIDKIAGWRRRYPDKIFIHRIDGPIRLYNSMNDKRDSVTNVANRLIADATVFQSEWSRKENHGLGLHTNTFETVIMNAPEPTIFNRNNKEPLKESGKARLIATSWSDNPNKGFDTYTWLDENLNFDKYEMTFVGRSPVRFRNIKHVPPVSTEELTAELKKHDIFIFASKIEACSNSLLEALHCGLPAIVYNSSSNPELLGNAGVLFSRCEEIPGLIEEVLRNYGSYLSGMTLPDLDDVGKSYYEFIAGIDEKVRNRQYAPKRLSPVDHTRILLTLALWKLHDNFRAVCRR